MKVTIAVKKEVNIVTLHLAVPVRHDDADIAYDFPGRDGDVLSGIIDWDTHKIKDWPQGRREHLGLKVCDAGVYELRDEENNRVAILEDDYVPNKLIPGEYGDYIRLDIDESGEIINWLTRPNFSDFGGIT